MKKAQQPGQIFMYILGIIVVSAIIVYGYKAISDFSEKGDEVAFLSFKQQLENTVKSMVSDYGTVKKTSLLVSGKYEKFCVVDFSTYSPGVSKYIESSKGNIPLISCAQNEESFEPLVCETWKQGFEEYNKNHVPLDRITLSNVFLLPSGDSFNLQNVKLPVNSGGIVCVPIKSGKINLNLYSVGDGVEISPEGIEVKPRS